MWRCMLLWIFIGRTWQKVFCRTCFRMGNLTLQISVHLSVHPSVRSSIRQHLPWVSYEHNSSYSFIPIILKLCMCFLASDAMKVCRQYIVMETPHTIVYRSFWKFAHVFSRICRCACGLDIIFKFIFVAFSTLFLFSVSYLRFMKVCTLWVPLERNLYNLIPSFENFCTSFSSWLKSMHVVCMSYLVSFCSCVFQSF